MGEALDKVTLPRNVTIAGESVGAVADLSQSNPQNVTIAEEFVDGIVTRSQAKSRLDAFLAAQGERVSRARWQDAIRQGKVLVNGAVQKKVRSRSGVAGCNCSLAFSSHPSISHLSSVSPSPFAPSPFLPSPFIPPHSSPPHSSPPHYSLLILPLVQPSYAVREGDRVQGSLSPPQSQHALEPSAIALHVVYEDDHVVVINKPPHMVLHRLDKGTSGLLVVAKDPFSQAHLSAQFKARTVHRSYLSLVIGTPSPLADRVDAPIGRDPKDRKRMAVLPLTGSHRSRRAASRYRVVESLAGGAAALVEWRLETGRTHQIRVHARLLGHPLIGDETYGGSTRHVSSRLLASLVSSSPLRSPVAQWIAGLDRPLLHAATLRFVHPHKLEVLTFEVAPPIDFIQALQLLRSL
ncbi:unnamed protein product [Closterium sp. Yama58-4]|nr:unnamed protein product [Closterium sp. Yama58-4]